MSDERRAQTTHGIWLSKSSSSDILVMDVEGTDGRERAEDQVIGDMIPSFSKLFLGFWKERGSFLLGHIRDPYH